MKIAPPNPPPDPAPDPATPRWTPSPDGIYCPSGDLVGMDDSYCPKCGLPVPQFAREQARQLYFDRLNKTIIGLPK
jgi:hypothetical protein